MDRYTSFRILLLAVFATFLAGSATSAWDVQTIDEPHNKFESSNITENVKLVKLIDNDGNPVDDLELENEEGTDLYYKYNASNDERISMKYFGSGYYYTNFSADYNKGLDIKYELYDSSSDGGVIDNETQSLKAGNMTVELDSVEGQEDYFNSKVKAGIEDLLFEVNVTDTVNNISEDNADVDLYFTNVSWTSQLYHLDNYEDGLYYNSKIDLPENTDSNYVLHINASNTAAVGYNNSFGAVSSVVETYPAINGKIQYMNASSGCNNQSFFTECERGTNIETGFNITESSAENVNLTLNLWNQETSEWENQSIKQMSLENGTYNTNINVPDINTSTYGKKLQLVYNATNDKREKVVRRNISYRTFDVGWRSSSRTALGTYDVELSLSKYFTPEVLTTSRLNGTVEIFDPTGENLAGFTLEDMEYRENSGLHMHEIDIPSSSETGIYSVQIEAENIYGDRKSFAESFNVTDITQTFRVNNGDDFEKDLNRTGNYTFNLSVENMVTSEHNLTMEFSGETENFTEINSGNEINLTEDSEKNVSIALDISTVDDYDGEVKFIDDESEYNETLDIEIDAPDCDYRDETVCIEGDTNVSSDERGNVMRSLEVRDFGHKDENKTFSIDVSGNVSDYLDVNPSSIDFNAVGYENSSMEKISVLNYSVGAPGYFEGVLEISNDEDSVEVPISLDSEAEANEVSMNTPSSVDLGSAPEGGEVEQEINVENTGDVQITVAEYSSDNFEVSGGSISIEPEEENTVSLTFSEITSSSGELTLTAESDIEEISRTVPVEANPVPDYSEQAESLRQEFTTLDRQIPSNSSLQTQLNGIQSRISEIETAYNQGNYEEAESTYNQVSSSLETIREQSRSDPGSGSEDPGTQDPGQGEGGGGFLPLVVGLFVIILIGFVVVTSIEPEPGDPLYNLLGE